MPGTGPEIYEFLNFRLNVTEHQLERVGGGRVHLSDKAFDTLCILIRNAGHLVPKNDLLEQVWAGAFVEENNLNKSIHAIRQALGRSRSGASCVETVRKHGFRFVEPVRRVNGAGVTGTLPNVRITESGAHAIVDLVHWKAMEGTIDLESAVPSPAKVASEPDTNPAVANDLEFPTRHAPIRLIAPIGIVLLLGVAVLVGSRLWQSTKPDLPPLDQKRLTTGGSVTRVAMSADGRHAAVVQNAAVKIFDVNTGEERLLVPAEKGMRILTLAFRPDGGALYFGKRTIENTPVTVYSIPITGGEPTRILDDIYGSLSFSPDRKRIAFLRRYPELNEYNLMTADADGKNISKLATSEMPNRFEAGASWSPDGKSILCPQISVEGGFHYTIARINSSTGTVDKIPNQRWTWALYTVWLPDAKNVLITAQAEGDLSPQIWRVDTETGNATKVTNDSFVYESLSGSADGRTFVAAKVLQNSHIWLIGPSPVQITSGFDKYDGVNGLAWAPDGMLYYHSRASERSAIWQMQLDGSGAKEVTTDSGGGFAISPDGRQLVFERQESGTIGLRLLDLVSGSERSLAEGLMASQPAFTYDGKSILFSLYDKKLSLWEIPVAGGEPKLISDEFQAARSPAVSPSGRYTAFAYNRALTGELEYGIAIMDNVSRQVVSMHPIKTGIGGNFERPTIRWSADETEIYYILIDLPTSSSNLAKIRLSDGTITQVTQFPDGRVFNFTVEPGGDRVALARGIVERDASIIKIDRGF